MSKTKDRQMFEAAMTDGYDFTRDADGDYVKPDTFEAYNGWKARAALKPADLTAILLSATSEEIYALTWQPDGVTNKPAILQMRDNLNAWADKARDLMGKPQASELTEDALKLMAVEFRKERKARLGFESEADADLRSMKVAYRALRATSGAEEVK